MPVSRVRYSIRARQTIGGARTVVRRDRAASITPAPPASAPKYLSQMNKAELQARAAALGLSTTGTNAELIRRIQGE